MAPELRSRSKAASAEKTLTKSKVTAPAVKRKAADDSSPVAAKKTKPLKSDVTSKKKSKASKPIEEAQKPTQPVAGVAEHLSFSDDDDDEEEEEEEQALVLAGIADNDGEDEIVHESVAFKEGQDVGKAPKPSKAVMKAARDKGGNEEPGVVYFGRLPHGFYEHELRNYLSQFGDLKNVRLSRNKKTGASKHYAFVEFVEESTAEIVAKTMNNYLLFGHILKCSVIPKSQVHPALFRGANKRFKKIPHAKLAGKILTKPLSEDKWAAKISRTNQKRADQAKKLKEMGYEFEAPELKTASAPTGIEVGEDVEKSPEAIEAPSTETEVVEATKPAEEEMDDGVESLDGELAVGKFSKIIPKEKVRKGNVRTKKPSKPKKARARA